MKKRLLKKRLRDATDEDVIMLSFERGLGKKIRMMIKREMETRFHTVITTMEIKMLRQMLAGEDE